MKKLLCMVILSVSTLNFCMEPETTEIVLALGGMALDEVTGVVKEVANNVQISMFGTTAEHGEEIKNQVMEDDCTIL